MNYKIFKVKDGNFLMVWDDKGLVATLLPGLEKSELQDYVKDRWPHATKDSGSESWVPSCQEKIENYYRGLEIDFEDQPVNWDQFTDFQGRVYQQLIKVPAGKWLSYGELAKKADSPKAARAVGACMAKNPIP